MYLVHSLLLHHLFLPISKQYPNTIQSLVFLFVSWKFLEWLWQTLLIFDLYRNRLDYIRRMICDLFYSPLLFIRDWIHSPLPIQLFLYWFICFVGKKARFSFICTINRMYIKVFLIIMCWLYFWYIWCLSNATDYFTSLLFFSHLPPTFLTSKEETIHHSKYKFIHLLLALIFSLSLSSSITLPKVFCGVGNISLLSNLDATVKTQSTTLHWPRSEA